MLRTIQEKWRIICIRSLATANTTYSSFINAMRGGRTGNCPVGQRYETSTLAYYKVDNYNRQPRVSNFDSWMDGAQDSFTFQFLYACVFLSSVAAISFAVLITFCILLSCPM